MSKQSLTPDDIAKIRQADLANIVKKVKSGKPLNAAERKLLEEAAQGDDAPEPQQLVTVTKLAQLYQVSRKTIYKWREDGRDVPDPVGKKEDLTAWRAWFAANPSAGHYDGKPRKDRESLLCEKLEIEIDIKRIELEHVAGRYIDASKAHDDMLRIISALRGEFLKLPNDCAGKLAGLTESKIQKLLRAEIIAIMDRASNDAGELFPS